jgi:hypothetical protein
MTTPKKAPTAKAGSEWLREARLIGETVGVCSTMMDHFENAIAAAERAEAKAAQEPGDSVEGLMEECYRVWSHERGMWPTIRLWRDLEGFKAAADVGEPDAKHVIASSYTDALKTLLSRITPAAHDATWLDAATFEEMEEWLPGDSWIREAADSDGYFVDRNGGPWSSGPTRPTRTEAVRAYLRQHPGLWEGKR